MKRDEINAWFDRHRAEIEERRAALRTRIEIAKMETQFRKEHADDETTDADSKEL